MSRTQSEDEVRVIDIGAAPVRFVRGWHCLGPVEEFTDGKPHPIQAFGEKRPSSRTCSRNHVATQYQRGSGREDVRPPAKPGEPTLTDNESTASYYGPSFMIDELIYNYDDGSSVENVLINCHYPISPTSFVLQYGIIVKKAAHLAGDAVERLAAASAEHIGRGFEQDIAIWRNKTRIDNPLLCEEDGPVYQLRRWYEQFYVDVADVTPDMTNRFEFELDTTRPVEAWKQEVAEIMASRSPAGASVS